MQSSVATWDFLNHPIDSTVGNTVGIYGGPYRQGSGKSGSIGPEIPSKPAARAGPVGPGTTSLSSCRTSRGEPERKRGFSRESAPFTTGERRLWLVGGGGSGLCRKPGGVDTNRFIPYTLTAKGWRVCSTNREGDREKNLATFLRESEADAGGR